MTYPDPLEYACRCALKRGVVVVLLATFVLLVVHVYFGSGM